ncbi:NAD-P-binding protein [Dentipellis sp. KUC8613]|nr:NAD-P-binding protein [Dentipellis sp. KUC8613]
MHDPGSVYPEIDPQAQYASKSHKGKVVLITGASRGIGEEVAITYAKAGASLILAARTQKALDAVKAEILRQVPAAEVLTVPTDVVEVAQVEAAVKAGIERFGKLDVVIANAGKADSFNQLMTQKDPSEWWNIVEVNIKGVYNFAHYTLPYLSKVNGYFIVTTSNGALIRMLNGSHYIISKEGVNTLVELIAIEFPNVKTFAVHPGVVDTEMARATTFKPVDSPQLVSSTYLYLTAGKADWLSGRYLSVTWDMAELQKDWKDKIEKADGFKSRLVVPA